MTRSLERVRPGALVGVEQRRRARRVRLMRILFVVGLLSWTSLAVWWATFFHRSNRQLLQQTLTAYHAEQRLHARELAQGLRPPLSTRFEIVSLPAPPEALDWPHVELPVDAQPKTEVIVVSERERERLRSESFRRGLMLAGEGTLLIGLLFVCLVVLYRMLVGEWRLNRQTQAFVHAVTHELKSPITGLRALLESTRSLDLPKEERAGYYDLGLAELKRLERLVDNVLLSSRLEARSYQPTLERVALEPVLEQLVARKTPRVRERGGEISLDVQAPAAMVDSDAFETVVENLVDNAIKYSADKPHVTVRTRTTEDGGVAIDVSDQGVGLTGEELSRIFDKFWRSPRATSVHAKGTGLGLYIARELARASGGELLATSGGTGKGTTFSLVLRS